MGSLSSKPKDRINIEVLISVKKKAYEQLYDSGVIIFIAIGGQLQASSHLLLRIAKGKQGIAKGQRRTCTKEMDENLPDLRSCCTTGEGPGFCTSSLIMQSLSCNGLHLWTGETYLAVTRWTGRNAAGITGKAIEQRVRTCGNSEELQ
ncbi:unnamed protein product [Caretta caretta]